MLRTTQDTDQAAQISCTGLSPSPVGFPNTVPLSASPFCLSYNPKTAKAILVWASPLSLATTDGIVSFPPGT